MSDGMTDLAPDLPTKPSSFRDVVKLWPSLKAMAADVGAGAWEVPKWSQRNNIPAEWWLRVTSTDVARDNGVTVELLATLASRENEARA